MLLADLVGVSAAVSATRSRSKKIELLAAMLRQLAPDEAAAAISYLSGKPRQDRLGVGWATVYAIEAAPAEEPSLEILEVDQNLGDLAGVSGPGSKKMRETLLMGMFGRATEAEQRFLRDLIVRNLRQGALEGVMADAVAVALEVTPDRVRRAAMLEGDLIAVASRALADGPDVLGTSALGLFTPVQPMLAKTASSAGEAVTGLGRAFVELKLDGARIQVHREGPRVSVFTRNLRDITSGLPEVVASVLEFPATSFILDGEALLFGPSGPEQFQDSMSRFGAEKSDQALPLRAYYFDCLHLDGVDLIDLPLVERRAGLAAVAGEAMVGSVLTDNPEVGDRFFEDAVAAGYEGVVIKDPELPYEAGRRGSGWLKVKPTHTLDLVILAAEWGSGRREGWLSNLHLGARDGQGGHVMLGKTFKGLTDEMLAWQTELFLSMEDHRSRNTVFLKPGIVYEIAFDGVQRSTRYPGGVALRFARVKRYREDKGPEDADTIETVRGFARS
ncbi:MAG TPA: ATP-dependent DNA ligase, partial [Acidimicrobiia bacterium]|nr:ATP-dependent DNA ligase [Acidimicrobiia bacterium]